jgi:hypothetical protein
MFFAFIPESYDTNDSGRSSDLLLQSAFPSNNEQWRSALNSMELTAAGTVQDFHLIPSQLAKN